LAVGLFEMSRCDGEVFLGGGEGGVAEEFADASTWAPSLRRWVAKLWRRACGCVPR